MSILEPFLNELPKELLEKIASYLDPRSFLRLSETSKRIRSATNNVSLLNRWNAEKIIVSYEKIKNELKFEIESDYPSSLKVTIQVQSGRETFLRICYFSRFIAFRTLELRNMLLYGEALQALQEADWKNITFERLIYFELFSKQILQEDSARDAISNIIKFFNKLTRTRTLGISLLDWRSGFKVDKVSLPDGLIDMDQLDEIKIVGEIYFPLQTLRDFFAAARRRTKPFMMEFTLNIKSCTLEEIRSCIREECPDFEDSMELPLDLSFSLETFNQADFVSEYDFFLSPLTSSTFSINVEIFCRSLRNQPS